LLAALSGALILMGSGVSAAGSVLAELDRDAGPGAAATGHTSPPRLEILPPVRVLEKQPELLLVIADPTRACPFVEQSQRLIDWVEELHAQLDLSEAPVPGKTQPRDYRELSSQLAREHERARNPELQFEPLMCH